MGLFIYGPALCMDRDEFLANQDVLGTPYTLGTLTGRGTRTRVPMVQHVEIGGMPYTWSTNIAISRLEMPTPPGQGATLSVGRAGEERTYRIFAITDVDADWVLALAHPNFTGRA